MEIFWKFFFLKHVMNEKRQQLKITLFNIFSNILYTYVHTVLYLNKIFEVKKNNIKIINYLLKQ